MSEIRGHRGADNAKGPTPEDAFWAFSVRVYARPEVARSCLGLQDGIGADVNLLLFCCWVAANGGGALDAEDLGRLVARARPWQEQVLRPLRRLRRLLRSSEDLAAVPGPRREELREGIKRLELEAERIEQALIVAAGPVPPGPGSSHDPASDARVSLERYLNWLGAAGDERARRRIDDLVAAVFDGDR